MDSRAVAGLGHWAGLRQARLGVGAGLGRGAGLGGEVDLWCAAELEGTGLLEEAAEVDRLRQKTYGPSMAELEGGRRLRTRGRRRPGGNCRQRWRKPLGY